MKLINVKPGIIESVASQALNDIERDYAMHLQRFIEDHREIRLKPWWRWVANETTHYLSDDEIKRFYDTELTALEIKMNKDKVALCNLIRGAKSACYLGCLMMLDDNELRLIVNYL